MSAPVPEAPSRPRRRGRTILLVVLGVVVTLGVLLLAVGALPCPGEDALLGPAGIPVAFLIGVVSFFSPCILPLLPGYLSFVSGLTGEEIREGRRGSRGRVLAGTTLFVLGFAAVFTALGASASAVGGFLNDHLSSINRVAGVIVMVIGVSFLVPGMLRFMEVERRPFLARAKPGVAGSFPLGLAFAVGWTPCVSPGLGVLLTLGLAENSVGRGALLLFFFSLGFGVWFILGGLGLQKALDASRWVRARARAIQVAGGILMLAVGALLALDLWGGLMSPVRRMIASFTTAC